MLYRVFKLLPLLALVLVQACSCEDIDLFGGSATVTFPPDPSCTYNNPHAQYDETIPELCDGNDNNCDCLAKPPEEQDSNDDGTRCGYGDDGVDEGCECWPSGKGYSVSWASSRQRCWLDEEGKELGTLEDHTTETGGLVGECLYGDQTCRELPEGGSQWGAWSDGPDRTGGTADDEWTAGGCLGAVGPATELCDGRDNNCDAHVDEGLKRMCWSGASNPDGTPQDWLVFNSPMNPETPCRTGIELCEDGQWSGCLNEELPTMEVCDSVDNDCDGVVDDDPVGQGDQCGLTDVGICSYGSLYCDGSDLMCNGPETPQIEQCDNLDNDCDGLVDEDLIRPCESACGSGFESCRFGYWESCNAPQPQEEICDAEDNDCDGQVDEGLECTCPPEYLGMLLPCQSNPQLVCGTGFMECVCVDAECSNTGFTDCMAMCAFEEQRQQDCDPTGGAPAAEACNAWDDDCDQAVDEGLVSRCYTGPPGTENIGECIGGQAVCQRGRWGNDLGGVFVDGYCEGEVLPIEETCNHLDDDCDGDIDEDLDAHEKVDMVFAIDRSGSMCNKIRVLRAAIEPYVLAFANSPHRFALVNIPGRPPAHQPDVQVNLTDSLTFAAALAQLSCDFWNEEPQYDAVEAIAVNSLGLTFRDDAWPMVVMMTDEHAQSYRQPPLTAADVRAVITPCTLGNCEADDTLEVFAIVPQYSISQWCAPANIAQECYRLYAGIDSGTIRGYLDDIFSDVCR